MPKYQVTVETTFHTTLEIEDAATAEEACHVAIGYTKLGEGANVVIAGPRVVEFMEV